MLNVVKSLVESLNGAGIRYCHWKSNVRLEDALDGAGDLDLLVLREDCARFEILLRKAGFKQASDRFALIQTSLHRYFGLDEETGILIHLHVSYRVLTGESLLKNYFLPLEGMLLDRGESLKGIPVPEKSAELIVWVLRMMVKHTSVVELGLLKRRGEDISQEVRYLLSGSGGERFTVLVEKWLPGIEKELLSSCLSSLKENSSLLSRVVLGLKVKRRLRMHSRYSPGSAFGMRALTVLRRISWRGFGNRKSKNLMAGGGVIAIVGADATGKSTVVSTIEEWLGNAFACRQVHLGKPPATFFTWLPRLFIPLARLLSRRGGTRGKERSPVKQPKPNLVVGLRSVLLAWDRRRLAFRAHRWAANGELVICDRYPSRVAGAMDSPRLGRIDDAKTLQKKLLQRFAQWEESFYAQIPPASLVIELRVPVEVAVKRNQRRDIANKETDEEIRQRHDPQLRPVFPASDTVELNTEPAIAEVIRMAKKIVWEKM